MDDELEIIDMVREGHKEKIDELQKVLEMSKQVGKFLIDYVFGRFLIMAQYFSSIYWRMLLMLKAQVS